MIYTRKGGTRIIQPSAHMGYLRHNETRTPATAPTVPGHGRSAKEIDMTDLTLRCAGIEAGRACVDSATLTEPVPLCHRHQMQVAAAVIPTMLSAALEAPQTARTPMIRDLATVQFVSKAQPAELDLSGGHSRQVYFIRNGSRVKIGHTINLRQRLTSFGLRAEAVVLLLDGGQRLEAALHRYFAHDRIRDTEWFRYTDEIKTYVASQLDQLARTRGRLGSLAFRELEIDQLLGSRSELISVIRVHMGERRGVHLTDIVKTLHGKGAPSHLTVTTLRRALTDHEIPVRSVRVGERVNVGVHRNDLPVGLAAD